LGDSVEVRGVVQSVGQPRQAGAGGDRGFGSLGAHAASVRAPGRNAQVRPRGDSPPPTGYTRRTPRRISPGSPVINSRHRIQFPPVESADLGQDEVFFYLVEAGERVRLRFHDYNEIYRRPGLYEQVFYDRLKCNSPKVVGDLLKFAVESDRENLTELRVLDLGAGNGIMGDVLKHQGVSRTVGADIIPEARDAAYRDRPHVYDEYYVGDFTDLQPSDVERLAEWSFNCLTCVAALGFGDIPAQAFVQALRLVEPGGWAAFNIKETFLDASDQSGFSRLIRELIFSEYLDLHQLQRYRHRLGMDGSPLYYFALIGKKTADIPEGFLEEHDLLGD